VNAMAQALTQVYGVKKGDRILVQSSNCNQLFESAFACWRIGAVWVPANFRGTPDDLAWSAQSSGAVGLICHSGFPDHAKHCAPDLKFIISIGKLDFGKDYDELVTAHAGQAPAMTEVDYDDPCWFFYTSGTTGKPKAAVLTHGHLAFVINNHLADLLPGTTEADASIAIAPLSHGAGIHALIQVARSVPTIIPGSDRFNAEEIWQLIARWRVSTMFTVPTILKMLVEHPAVDQVDHSSLRHVIYAGAPMYRADQIYALDKLGPVLVQYFGLGEVTGAITVLRPDQHGNGTDTAMREGTCGMVRTGMQIQIQDKNGNEVATGETGEFCLIGPAVFAGYWDNPEANDKAFRNGWFRTGDIGHVDKDGFYYLTGRESDMYISGGSNIYPREIEEKILMHPNITETAIFGIPDPKWGEIGVAVCVVTKGDNVDADTFAAWLSPKIASYKMPRIIEFWDSIPKSGYGKITKKLVRAEYERKLTEAKAN
ncbi:MAG: AMP-binding protein, partial [Rhizobiales bacterium]|nr:AMP-binding protein [Hyphomicrobiales bacterium]